MVDERGSVKGWLLAFLVALPLSFGTLLGVGCALGANACPFGDAEPFTSTNGEEIWLANCQVCHGVDAAGSAQNPRARSLVAGPSAELTLEAMIGEIEDGSPGLMPRFEGKLTDEQIQSVARYVFALRGEADE